MNGLAKVFARIAAILSRWLLKREWNELHPHLIRVYQIHQKDSQGCPSLLAQQLLISGEDHRFFDHGGIDPIAICRAIWRCLALRRLEGASTIEMQLIRVLSGRYERSISRKIREMGLATLVSEAVPKEALPAIYLRIGYFGWRMTGIRAVCRRTRLNPHSLSPFEAAKLVAQLKYPQPKVISTRRRQQIDTRARHLLRLHARHREGTTYLGLAGPAYATV